MIKKYKLNPQIFLLVVLIFSSFGLKAQAHLEDYIQEGINSNESIKEQQFILEKNMYLLSEAKRMFLPSVAFSTTYTKAEGGRTIDIPLGDLMNGVYNTLNQLTGTNTFPQLQNQHVLINPDNFYDAKFRITQPLLNAELMYNRKIKQKQVLLQQTEVLLFKRELVKEIKIAYYNYLKATNALEIYQSYLMLVKEGERVNEKLFDNGKINRSALVRSRNEVSKIEASIADAFKNVQAAQYYFNFLLNRPLTDSILIDEISSVPAQGIFTNDVANREELVELDVAKTINQDVTGLAKSYIMPTIGANLDLGSQAFDWQFDDRSRYYFLGISLEWNLFAFGKHTYHIKQAQAAQRAISSQKNYVEHQLLTELKVRQTEMENALAQYQNTQSQLQTSQIYYSDISKMYKEGTAIYIELLDAQNQWVDAQLKSNIALFNTWISFTAIERASASFNIQ